MSGNSAELTKNEAPGEDLPGSSKSTEQDAPPAEALPAVNVNPLDTNTVSDVKNLESHSTPLQEPPSISLDVLGDTSSADPDIQPSAYASVKAKTLEVPNTIEDTTAETDTILSSNSELPESSKVEAPDNSPVESKAGHAAASKAEASTAEPHADSIAELPAESEAKPSFKVQAATPNRNAAPSDTELKNVNDTEIKDKVNKSELPTLPMNEKSNSAQLFLLDGNDEGSESGTEEEQSSFMEELENFFRDRSMEFKPPKFYGEGLNCLKLWRAVTRLGGYEKVTSCKLWRQVGESFKPPKTCTTVSWTFRGFYEKASGSGRARRDAAARAMQGWHSQHVLGSDEISDPIIKDKNHLSLQKCEKQLKSRGLIKRKKPSYMELAVKAARTKTSKSQLDVAVVDLGPPADWVKINVQRTKDCFEVYALVPGLLREEVRVQSDPAGRLVISGEPEHPDNPWGVTPFKKVVSLPARIDPHLTSAVVTLHGQLFVRVPFEQTD
ncbi:protein dead ringer [Citrus sinensis]|uniref:Protein dead ringer n=1 Tax=Citrus sinensis TaxID=2711 RepID=A0ACB8IYP6_CITSI|nr:AT-rich interactive domain-containing protein 3 isoform X2 [Citrus x clementina]KAH9662203.1 protein dead ringer [Citrus sinensis]KAH9710435.1 protein dead ringer [Citrus sinensis]